MTVHRLMCRCMCSSYSSSLLKYCCFLNPILPWTPHPIDVWDWRVDKAFQWGFLHALVYLIHRALHWLGDWNISADSSKKTSSNCGQWGYYLQVKHFCDTSPMMTLLVLATNWMIQPANPVLSGWWWPFPEERKLLCLILLLSRLLSQL